MCCHGPQALHYVSLLRELSAPYPNIKSFIMVTGFFWKEGGGSASPLSPASPEEAPPPPVLRPSDTRPRGGAGGGGGVGLELAPPQPWESPEETQHVEVDTTEVRQCV